MIRNIRALGLSAVALLAMGAMVASAASAAQFDATSEKVEVKAEQIEESHVFTVDGTSVTCTQATFATNGEVEAPAETLTVHPSYSGCTAFGFANATVTTTGCDYVLHANGEIDVACSEGNSIVISASTCEAKVGTQSGLESVSYTNIASSPTTVEVSANVTGIAVNKTKDGLLCPLSGTGAGTGAYEGDTLAKGTSGGTPVGISHTP